MEFITALESRNSVLFYFGLANFALAILFFYYSRYSSVEVAGVNAWYKPIKFALSIGIYSWTMGWLMHYLYPGKDIDISTWLIVLMLGLEIWYIAVQAGKGELSHYNVSTPFHSNMFALMAVGATMVSFVTAYIALKFFLPTSVTLPDYYLWAIRIGLILFVIFSLEGFVMGANSGHIIGGPENSQGIPFLNWSRQYGDPRVAHFIGMHALQVVPLLAFYLLRDTRLTITVGILYALLAVYVLAQALNGKPFLKFITG